MNSGELNQLIVKAAKSVAMDWPGVIEPDDAQQEIWCKLLESKNYVEQIVSMEPGQRFESLKRIGHQVAARYRNDYELFTGNTFYGSEHVRSLLDSGVLTIARAELGQMRETLTEFLDSHEAFESLKGRNQRYAQLIWSVYVDKSDVFTESERRAVRRAVKALTELMNAAHRRRNKEREDGIGTREVMSNARARAKEAYNK